MRSLFEFRKRINTACIPFVSLSTVVETATEQKVYLFSSEFPSNCYSAFLYLRTLYVPLNFSIACYVQKVGTEPHSHPMGIK